MQININDPKQMLSHVLLGDDEVVNAVTCTEEWTKDKKLTVEVSINGVKVDAESFENTLKNLFEQVENHYSEVYNADNIDNLVEKKAEELIKNHADSALDKLGRLMEVIEDPENIIKPYWER